MRDQLTEVACTSTFAPLLILSIIFPSGEDRIIAAFAAMYFISAELDINEIPVSKTATKNRKVCILGPLSANQLKLQQNLFVGSSEFELTAGNLFYAKKMLLSHVEVKSSFARHSVGLVCLGAGREWRAGGPLGALGGLLGLLSGINDQSYP